MVILISWFGNYYFITILMYANNNYNMSISQAIYINIVLFAALNAH